MSLVCMVIPRCPGRVGGRRQCGGGAPPGGIRAVLRRGDGLRPEGRARKRPLGSRRAGTRQVSNAAGVGRRPGSRAAGSGGDGPWKAGRRDAGAEGRDPAKRPCGGVTEGGANERRYSGCGPPFAGAGMAAPRPAGLFTGEPRAVRRGCRNVRPPGAHEPQRARRGVTLARRLQFDAIPARYRSVSSSRWSAPATSTTRTV